MKAFKKVIRWTPIVTMCMVIVMHIGMRGFSGGGDLSWVSDGSKFSFNDVKSLFGHDGMAHWLSNSITFAAYFVPIELMLKKKQQSIMLLFGIIVAWLLIKELWFDDASIGASGWINAIPGCMLGVSAWKVTVTLRPFTERLEAMLLPGIVFVLEMLLANQDLSLVGKADGIGHVSHLIGAAISTAVGFVAIAVCLHKWIAQAICEKKARRYG